MIYFLDTNACIALIKGKPASVRTRFQRVVDGGAEVNASTVVAFELWYGVGKSQQRDANTGRLETFLAGPIRLAAFDEEDAKFAGNLRAESKRRVVRLGHMIC